MRKPTFLATFEKYKGPAALTGGFLSVTVGATWWLAAGGAAAFLTSANALARPEIAAVLSDLPEYHARTEASLAVLQQNQEDLKVLIQRMADTLDAFRAENEQVVEWAPEHSQSLTDEAGGCFAGEPCTVYFRGRRTQLGAECVFQNASPRLVLATGQEFPVEFLGSGSGFPLTRDFETLPITFLVPAFAPQGTAGIVVLYFYVDCPFTAEGAVVERQTFRLTVEIKA